MVKVDIHGAAGQILNALVEIEDGDIIVHSRHGKSNNREYRPALEAILDRLGQNGIRPEVYLDSAREQHRPIAERQIVQPSELVGTIEKQFNLIIRQSNADGPGHSAYKRLRLRVPKIPTEQLQSILAGDLPGTGPPASPEGGGGTGGSSGAGSNSSAANSIPLTDEERSWVEGNVKVAKHLKRERSGSLPREFKDQFRKDHGKLFCEDCERDFIDVYGAQVAEACFEAHHTLPVAEMTEGHETTLDQLRLLCANCHRATHRKMAKG